MAAAFHAWGQGQPSGRFPAVTGTDLNGRQVSLPRDFAGPVSLVFVAFEMRQQEDVDTWRAFVTGRRQVDPGLTVLELPTISRGYSLMRFVIDNGMRSGIPETSARASTIPLYLEVKEFMSALGVSTPRQILALVVTPSGEILARASGRFSDDGAAEISRALDAARGTM